MRKWSATLLVSVPKDAGKHTCLICNLHAQTSWWNGDVALAERWHAHGFGDRAGYEIDTPLLWQQVELSVQPPKEVSQPRTELFAVKMVHAPRLVIHGSGETVMRATHFAAFWQRNAEKIAKNWSALLSCPGTILAHWELQMERRKEHTEKASMSPGTSLFSVDRQRWCLCWRQGQTCVFELSCEKVSVPCCFCGRVAEIYHQRWPTLMECVKFNQ